MDSGVSAQAQQQRPLDSNQDGILSVVLMELDEKIEKLPKDQPDISTVVNEKFTLRQAINAFLYTQPALRRGTREEVKTEDNFSRQDVDQNCRRERSIFSKDFSTSVCQIGNWIPQQSYKTSQIVFDDHSESLI